MQQTRLTFFSFFLICSLEERSARGEFDMNVVRRTGQSWASLITARLGEDAQVERSIWGWGERQAVDGELTHAGARPASRGCDARP